MSRAKVIFVLAGWMMLMGFFGFLKTGVLMPILVNGAMAVRTTVLGWFTYRGSKWGYYFTMIWLAVSAVGSVYFCFFDNHMYTVSSTDGYMMFGSIAVFSAAVFIFLLRLRKNLATVKSSH